MNSRVVFTLMFLLFTMQAAFASFPVERHQKNATVPESATVDAAPDAAGYYYTPRLAHEKSRGIALILVITLGLLAAHRWYLGYPWMFNVMYIFSFGGFGILLVVDIIRILVGTLTPAKGRYKKTFF